MTPAVPNLTPGHSPSLIAATEKVRDVKISPSGKYIVYQVQPFYKSSDKSTSRLWLAETDVPNSAKPVTDGLFNDRAAVFHPNGRRIYFLSNRHHGKGAHIYSLEVENEDRGHPVDITANLGQKGAQAFEISPNGIFVAFTCVDDGGQHKTSDATLYHEKTGLSKLKICDIRSGDIWTIDGIRKDKHVESFSWISNGKELLYRLRDNKGVEYAEGNIIMERVSIDSDGSEVPRIIDSYERSPSSPTLWLPSGHIVELQSFEPRNTLDARTLFIHGSAHDSTHDRNSQSVRRLYGEKDDAVRMVNARPTADDSDAGEVAIEVSVGVDTNIDIARFESRKGDTQEIFTLFKTNADAVWFGAWDARRVTDEEGNSSYVAAVVLSSGERHQPPNVWAGRSQFGTTIREMRQLSFHLKWLKDAPIIRTERVVWKADDGMELDGMVRYPPGYEKSSGPLPTVLFIHGGPYRRDIMDYMPYFCNWREMLASAGYLVVSPNYRGSQGRGHDFAHAANLGIGMRDWPDCESMVDEAIRLGLADPDRLAVAGWSHGGSLAAWGVTQTKTRFKAAVVGAGVSNWEGMVMESGSPELEAAIGQRVPWDEEANTKVVGNRRLSPIHAVIDVTTAVLILHGEKDERVPVGQGIGLWRGLRRKAAQRGRDGAQLVVYPREPHG
ncbi:alpha/beta-hydrolase [Pleurotus eryngii]|uniref:Dipeptidyl-peptidase V n=1 Tax=Pleurotus eryngii TaxID=5323 RepID=A0A9P6A9I0_PLEER|nr:alpha/beta-hydrolase [Pleurotus eryngii]